MRRTQTSTWGELLDRVQPFYEDGTRDELDPDLASALLEGVFGSNPGPKQRQAFLDELLPAYGICCVEDLGGESLTEVLEGILN